MRHLVDVYKADSNAFRLTLLVAVLCVVFDPTAAILVGSILGLISQSARSTAGYAEVLTSDDDSTLGIITPQSHQDVNSRPIDAQPQQARVQQQQQYPIALYRIVGDLSFLSAVRHVERLRQFHDSYSIILSFRFCRSIDLDGLHQLHRYLTQVEQQHSHAAHPSIVLCGTNQLQLQAVLSASGWYSEWQAGGRVLDTVAEAIDALSGEVSEADGERLKMKMLQAKGQRANLSTLSLPDAV